MMASLDAVSGSKPFSKIIKKLQEIFKINQIFEYQSFE